MNVTVVSTHRADRGHYARLLRVLRATPGLAVSVWDGQGAVLDERADVGVVLGDRYEMMLAAAALVEARVPLVHIHGGEHTYGSLDERWRWAITAMADYHCVATREAYDDLTEIGTGEQYLDWHPHMDAWRVRFTGAPGLDDIGEHRLALPKQGRWEVIALMNPVSDARLSEIEAAAVMGGLRSFYRPVRFASNGDRGAVNIGSWATDPESFRDVLAAAHVIVGNSSAGIIEAPSLGTWCVNVGERQAGRVRAGNVIDVPADPARIRAAVEDALSRPRYTGPNPYRHPEGKACEAIRDVIVLAGEGRAHHGRDGEPRDRDLGAAAR